MLRTGFFFPLVLVFSLISCAARKTAFSSACYFDGLRISGKDKAQAVRYFRTSIQKDSGLPAILAKETLLPLLYEQSAYDEIIALTEQGFQAGADTKDKRTAAENGSKTDLTAQIENADLVHRYRLSAMIHTKHPQSETELLHWLFFNAFSAEHLRFFEDSSLFSFFLSVPGNIQKQIVFRTAVYKRDYGRALTVLKEQVREHAKIVEEVKNELMLFFDLYDTAPAAFPDICSAVLYGSRSNAERASYAEQFIGASVLYAENAEKAFHCRLYAARLYARGGANDKSFEQFEETMKTAPDTVLFDKALWYYLDTLVKTSSRQATAALQKYAPQWNDASYFDDILELLSYNLLAARNWKGYYAVYRAFLPYMSAESASKYAFIAGRLAETGMLESASSADYVEAYKTAYENTEGNLYYRLLAAERLDIPFSDMERSLLQRKKKRTVQPDMQAELLLHDCIAQGFEKELYPFFLRFKDRIGADAAVCVINALRKQEFYPETLRAAVYSFGQSDVPIKKTQLEMLYPRFYDTVIVPLCANYGVPEYLVYALIRSESFFDKNISSAAGASGLTQLMESTAADIARKLKIREYDLSDPHINSEFGIFYLQELIGRLNGSPLLALFSYNAGITKVRRWANSYPELSRDLLLEVLPYKETREYGQKVLTAAALYACLYYDKTTHDIVREIMR